jgi:hypothetical protein
MNQYNDVQIISNFFLAFNKLQVVPIIDSSQIHDYIFRVRDIEFGIDLIKLAHTKLKKAYLINAQNFYITSMSDVLKTFFNENKKPVWVSITMKPVYELDKVKINEVARTICDFITKNIPDSFQSFKFENESAKNTGLPINVLAIRIDNSPYIFHNQINIDYKQLEAYDLSEELDNLIKSKELNLKNKSGNPENSLLLIIAENINGEFKTLLDKSTSKFIHKSSYNWVYLVDTYSNIYYKLNTRI